MKKAVVVIISVLIVALAAAVIFFDFSFSEREHFLSLPQEVSQISFMSGADILLSPTIDYPEQIADLLEILDGAPRTEQPEVSTWIFRLSLSSNEDIYHYNVFRWMWFFYLADDEDWYLLDSTELVSFLGGVDGFYRYEEFPRASLNLGPTVYEWPMIPIVGGEYTFRAVDLMMERFRTPDLPAEGYPLIITEWEQNRLPDLNFFIEPTEVQVTVFDGQGNELFSGTQEESERFVLAPGSEHQVLIIAEYNPPPQVRHYLGTLYYQYYLHTADLPVSFEISGEDVGLGEALVLRVRNMPQDETVRIATSLPVRPSFYPDGQGGMVGLLPVSIFTSPGDHFIELGVGNHSKRFQVTVLHTEFPVQRMTVDTSITDQTLNSAQANNEYRETIHPLRYTSDDVRHWEGRFTEPVDVQSGRITTPFAVFRYVNGVPTSRHAAIDIALPEGTPIYAPAAGRVVFAGYLQLTGYTIMIEHGFGLKTWYYHMVSIDVAVGDMVQQGERIAAVGSTGFSTGPHLHYAMSVYSTFINPDTAEHTDIFVFHD